MDHLTLLWPKHDPTRIWSSPSETPGWIWTVLDASHDSIWHELYSVHGKYTWSDKNCMINAFDHDLYVLRWVQLMQSWLCRMPLHSVGQSLSIRIYPYSFVETFAETCTGTEIFVCQVECRYVLLMPPKLWWTPVCQVSQGLNCLLISDYDYDPTIYPPNFTQTSFQLILPAARIFPTADSYFLKRTLHHFTLGQSYRDNSPIHGLWWSMMSKHWKVVKRIGTHSALSDLNVFKYNSWPGGMGCLLSCCNGLWGVGWFCRCSGGAPSHHHHRVRPNDRGI